jgi:hypothetical protein
MNIVATVVTVLLLAARPLAAQRVLTQVTASQEIAGAMPFEIPSLTLKGDVRPAADHRLFVVTLLLGDEPIETEVRRFRLVTSGGAYDPIGAGGGATLIIPLDRIPVDQEVGQILPSDAIVSLIRRAGGSVTIEAEARGTIAFLYELPQTAAVRSLTLPDGRALRLIP